MYHKHFSTRKTSQSEPIPGTDQVQNSAGGYTWAVDDWTRLDRFLILGTEGGTYYIGEQALTVQNAEAVLRCIKADGERAVKRAVEISEAGRAAKNDPALFVLAMCAGLGDAKTRRLALDALPRVARIGTHLFTFLTYTQAFRGWGRGMRRAVGAWYTDKNVDSLAYQLIKYRQRGNWTHRDVLRKAHPKDAERNALFNWVTQGTIGEGLPQLIHAFLEIQKATSSKLAADLIRAHRLPREAVPTNFLNDKEVWEALLEDMPMTALIRNLGNLSKAGVLLPGKWEAIKKVTDQLGDAERVHKARIHPIQVLVALVTYAGGQGVRGSGAWEAVPQIIDALDAAFYTAFDNVTPTGKRWLLGLDVSGSMNYTMGAVPNLSCMMGAAAMAMVTARTEERHAFMAFSHQPVPFPISRNERLDDVVRRMTELPFGGTDCSLPMLYALANHIEVDVFALYTDNETWAGNIHPSQALVEYRNKMGIPAKLVVVGMASNGFSIADPNDGGMLDVVGFSTDVPTVLSQFALLGE